MDFNYYQHQAKKTAFYPRTNLPIYPVLGLASEAGEVAGKLKKAIRDSNGKISEENVNEIKAELGDILWYLSQVATELGISLSDVAQYNLLKLQLRMQQNKISGSGDRREDWSKLNELKFVQPQEKATNSHQPPRNK